MITDATISVGGQYRYVLIRRWSDRPVMVWCMLNPSTADASVDDPTIRRCITFAMREEHGGIHIVNLMAYRAADPIECLVQPDPCGPENDDYLREAARESGGAVVVAWGSNAPRQWVENAILCFRQVGNPVLRCLGTTKDGSPRHPLYIRRDAPFIEWKQPKEAHLHA